YIMNEKVPPTASNRRKKELAREGDLVTYKRKRKTIDPSTVVPPNTVDSANEGVSKGVNIPTESAEGVNIPQGSEFETEFAQVRLGAQPPLPNVCPDFDENIPIFGGYSEGEGATSNDDVSPSVKSLLRNFRFHRARSIALGQDLNAFNSLKARGAGILLSLKKLKSHCAYKLEMVLSDGTVAAAKKKKGLTPSHGYLHISQSLVGSPRRWTPMHTCTVLVGNGTYLLRIDIVHHEHSSQSSNINLNDQQITALNDQLQKLKEDKENESEANINLREALKEKCKEIESLKADNTILLEQIDMQLPPAIPPVLDTTLAKKYEDLLAAHEDIKKKLIAKDDFHKKLVNSEEKKKILEVDYNEWEIWRQALKKSLASEGMEDMGDPTFEELFKQNERSFSIAQQGTKGDYQEDLVSTAVTLENVIIARREKMAKKKKM
ncbi:hypothetical protein GIB67_010608, partial [Kingdonia uniflora]